MHFVNEDMPETGTAKMPTEQQLELAQKNLDYILEWVTRFDNKNYIVLGIETGMLGTLAALAPEAKLWYPLMIAFAALSLILLAIGLLLVYLGNYPRLKGPNDSLFYFGSICKTKLDEYERQFRKRSAEEHLKDLLGQCHRNSEILKQKFSYLTWAYRMLFIGVTPWAITIYLFRTIPAVKGG